MVIWKPNICVSSSPSQCIRPLRRSNWVSPKIPRGKKESKKQYEGDAHGDSVTSGQSYKAPTIVIYDSRGVPDLKLPHIATLEL